MLYKGPDYGLNPSRIPYNISGDSHRDIRQFVVSLCGHGALVHVNLSFCNVIIARFRVRPINPTFTGAFSFNRWLRL